MGYLVRLKASGDVSGNTGRHGNCLCYDGTNWYSSTKGWGSSPYYTTIRKWTLNESTWNLTQESTADVVVSNYACTSMAVDANYIYLGFAGTLYVVKKSDLTLITSASVLSGYIYRIVLDSNGYIHCLGSTGIYAYSFDGVNLSFITSYKTSPFDGTVEDGLWTGSRLFAVVYKSGSKATIGSFTFSGAAYTKVTSYEFSSATSVQYLQICTDGTYYYVCGSDYYLRGLEYSSDTFSEKANISWTGSSPGGIAYDGVNIYIVYLSTTSAVLVFRFDGTSFTYKQIINIEVNDIDQNSQVAISAKSVGFARRNTNSKGIQFLHSDLVAQFTADKTRGGEPLTVNFTAT